MIRSKFGILCLTSLTLAGCIGKESVAKDAASQQATVQKDWSVSGTAPTQTKGAFFTGVYRNVFAEMGKPQAEISQKIQQAYDTYFSSTDTNRLYFEFGPGQAYIKDIAHDDIRSEGQSYGMMLAVQRNDQARFDKLWNFANAHMRVQDAAHPSYRGYAWAVDTKGEICDENSAPDGEEYFAMALYFAHNRWGSAAGPQANNNYRYWADQLLDVMKNRPSQSGDRKRRVVTSSGAACVGVKLSDKVTSVPLFDPVQKQVLFNATKGEAFTDPSYHLPAFYNLFAIWGPPADAEFWNSAAATSRSFLARAMNPQCGLTSEYANFDGGPHKVPWNSLAGQFAYDSWRVGGNVGMDWAWMMQPGTELQARADALVSFFAKQGSTSYLALWKVDCTNGNGFHSPGLVAMNAIATLATTEAVKPQAQELVEDLWNTALPTGQYRYYDGLLYTFALLHLSGEYRIHMPKDAK
jgi:oligosaccharide reducing-end xylanase